MTDDIRLPHSVITAADPPPQDNGGCAQCGGPRPKPTNSRHGGEHPLQGSAPSPHVKINHEALAAAREDPFCSTPCCRAWYGLPEIDPMPGRQKSIKPYRGSQHQVARDALQRRLERLAQEPDKRFCKGCGCLLGDKTDGCRTCYGRHYGRNRARKVPANQA